MPLLPVETLREAVRGAPFGALLHATQDARARLSSSVDRARALSRMAVGSGLVWEARPRGLAAAAAVLLGPHQTPSHIYRIHGKNTPAKPCLLWHDRMLTFGEVDADMDAIALAMRRRGFGRERGMVLMMRNRPEFILASGGAGRLGAPAVSASWRSTAAELVYLVHHCGALGLAFEHDLWPVVEEARKKLTHVPPENFFSIGGPSPGCTPFEALLDHRGTFDGEGEGEGGAVVIYTSGTTGKPKGAVRRFPKGAFGSWLQFIAETPMRADDVHLACCPLYHSTGFGFLALSQLVGGTVVLLDEFKAEPFLEAVHRHRVTTSAVVPTMLHRILALGPEALSKYDTRSLRILFSGGAPLPGPLALEVMDRFGDILFNFYGATETGLVTLAKPADLRAAPWTIGRALPGNEIRLLDDAGGEVEEGAVGELFARNPMLVSGYHQDDAATRASMRDGFFSVGDLARRDAAGRYFIEGRKRDMIISGGVNVYPAEVESVLESHTDVAEVAVIGVPDSDLGERVCAFVVARKGTGLDEGHLKAYCRERLSGPKVPREYVFLDALPRNPTGKVLKRDLRAQRS